MAFGEQHFLPAFLLSLEKKITHPEYFSWFTHRASSHRAVTCLRVLSSGHASAVSRVLSGAFTGKARAKLNVCRSILAAFALAASWNYHAVNRWEKIINKRDGFPPQIFPRLGRTTQGSSHTETRSRRQVFCCVLPSVGVFSGEPGIYTEGKTPPSMSPSG